MRLSVKSKVLRELYFRSGNQCAFTGCNRTMFNDYGDFVGEVCHIEAALPGGERFNVNQSNDDRRAISNLLILCHDHHVETDDESKYTTQRLQKMKRDHEMKFSDVVQKLHNSLEDITKLQDFEYCISLEKINGILNWGNSVYELEQVVPSFNELVDKLRILDPQTRYVFVLMIEKSKGKKVLLGRIERSLAIDEKAFSKYVLLLNDEGLISYPDQDELGNNYVEISLHHLDDYWMWHKDFSCVAKVSLEEIVYNMNFRLLDE